MAYSVINKSTHSEHIRRLSELATTPGLQRRLAKAALKEIGDGYAFQVAYGRGVAAIAGTGDLYEGRLDSFAESGKGGKAAGDTP